MVPWLKAHDYLLEVGSCRTIPEFTRTACKDGIEKGTWGYPCSG